jgi:hypothetical protein
MCVTLLIPEADALFGDFARLDAPGRTEHAEHLAAQLLMLAGNEKGTACRDAAEKITGAEIAVLQPYFSGLDRR